MKQTGKHKANLSQQKAANSFLMYAGWRGIGKRVFFILLCFSNGELYKAGKDADNIAINMISGDYIARLTTNSWPT